MTCCHYQAIVAEAETAGARMRVLRFFPPALTLMSLRCCGETACDIGTLMLRRGSGELVGSRSERECEWSGVGARESERARDWKWYECDRDRARDRAWDRIQKTRASSCEVIGKSNRLCITESRHLCDCACRPCASREWDHGCGGPGFAQCEPTTGPDYSMITPMIFDGSRWSRSASESDLCASASGMFKREWRPNEVQYECASCYASKSSCDYCCPIGSNGGIPSSPAANAMPSAPYCAYSGCEVGVGGRGQQQRE
ncbi:hypothetical protein BV22DRAFT_1116509 [Leucogyrophana mollusca]|uniref:Uncharacterized protein n=1 Tax=Leucogyrophana mollusca TaxID=85980 RepID=A0ACB8BX38_9AGAM|nr:hypothetical protein BV22DRAFT_1116509 [Leucogyrophana mollusca]